MRATRTKGERLATLAGLLIALPICVFGVTRPDSGAVQAAAVLVALVLFSVVHLFGVYLFGRNHQE